MSKRLTDFLSSFGIMLAGVVLLFVGSIRYAAVPARTILHFPASNPRLAMRGGDEDIPPPGLPVSRPHVPLPINSETYPGSLTAAAALVVDDKTNVPLFLKNQTEVRPLASVTKLMSAPVLLDLPIKWSKQTTVVEDDVDTSSHHINVGETYTLEDLWHIALIGSSNSAITTLVRESGLTPVQFVERMNKKAAELQLPSLHFVEPTGLSSANIGNAVDISRLLRAALKSKKIAETLQVGEYYAHPLNQDKPRRVWSTDWLLTNWVPNSFNKDAMIGKTGYIAESGYNFVVRLTDNNAHTIRVVILGAESNEARFSEARDLAEWIFAHYLWPDEKGYEKLAE